MPFPNGGAENVRAAVCDTSLGYRRAPAVRIAVDFALELIPALLMRAVTERLVPGKATTAYPNRKLGPFRNFVRAHFFVSYHSRHDLYLRNVQVGV